jgi:hypothetical protein
MRKTQMYMNGHTCLGCGEGFYDGYDTSETTRGQPVKTMPCHKCGHQAPSRMTQKAFLAAVKARDEKRASINRSPK